MRIRRAKGRGLACFVVAAAVGFSLGAAIPAFAQSDECLLEVQEDGSALSDNVELCDTATGKKCTFALRLCLNQADGSCSAGDIKKKVRAKGHCGPVGKLQVTPAGDAAVCGSEANIPVRTKKNGAKEGKCSITVGAKTRDGRKDVEKFTLVCKPSSEPCEGGTTTTSTQPPVTTTSTTVASTTTSTTPPSTTTSTTVQGTTTTIATTTTTLPTVTTTTILGTSTTVVTTTTSSTTTTGVEGTTTTTTTSSTTTTGVEGTTTTTISSTTTTIEEETTTTTISTTSTTVEETTTTTSSTTTTTPSTTTTTIPTCDCCTSSFVQFTTLAPSGTETGTVQSTGTCSGPPNEACDADGDCTSGTCTGPAATTLSLTSGGLYFGGNGVGVPLPNQVPDEGVSLLKIENCTEEGFSLAATTDTDVGGDKPWRRCTSGAGVTNAEYPGKPGCLFGPPLPIPNNATSVCIVNRISADATGTGNCQGDTNNLALPLFSDLYLTGPTLGNAPCPRCLDGGGTCSPGTDCCESGPNVNQPCVPGTTLTGASNPTSHDCPPPAPFIGSLPIPFNLGTGTQTKTATDFTSFSQVFCGFCGRSAGSQPSDFRGVCTGGTENGKICNGGVCATCVTNAACVAAGGSCAPTTCTSDTMCGGFATGCGAAGAQACNRCRQRTSGAFGAGAAQTITENGSSPSTCVASGTHNARLVSVFCIPPAFDQTVDSNGDLPGPGAVSLPGTLELLP